MKDQLTTCRKCSSPLCYERHNDTLITWDCLQCGFTTNTLFIDNTEAVLSYESMLPSLFRDIKFIDNDSFVWYPSTVTKEGVGIIFPDGTSKVDWKWAFARHIPVTEAEKERFKKKDEEGYHKFKTDMKNVIHFDQQYFSQALEAAGLI
mgnify:FL=1|jgi:hypothetical protein